MSKNPRTKSGRALVDHLVRLATQILGSEEYPPVATDQFVREVLAIEDEAARLTVEKVHWANQWRNGGDHPNTSDITNCGSCAYLLDDLATADIDEEAGK